MKTLTEILDWSEVWALLVPLAVIFIFKPSTHKFPSIYGYLLISLPLYSLIDFSWKFKDKFDLPEVLHDNQFLYNALSIIRFLCFSYFFIQLKLPFKGKWQWLIPALFIAFGIYNFLFLESFKTFSNHIHLLESSLILFYCLAYYIRILKSDQVAIFTRPEFWFITGICLYEAINLPIFGYYNKLGGLDEEFAIDLWNVHNIIYIILCLFIAKGFYESSKQRY